MDCETYLEHLPNRVCMEQFLKYIPKYVQTALNTSITTIQTIADAEKILDTYLYAQYLVALANLAFEIAKLEAKYKVFFDTLKQLQVYVKIYRN